MIHHFGIHTKVHL